MKFFKPMSNACVLLCSFARSLILIRTCLLSTALVLLLSEVTKCFLNIYTTLEGSEEPTQNPIYIYIYIYIHRLLQLCIIILFRICIKLRRVCHSRTSCDLGHVKYKDENRIELYSLSVRERDLEQRDEAMR